jgi:hypothetical protein
MNEEPLEPLESDTRTEVFVALDRIEGELAVLLRDSGGRLLIPAGLLPSSAREGTVLRLRLICDSEETERRLSRMRNLRRDLLERGEGRD